MHAILLLMVSNIFMTLRLAWAFQGRGFALVDRDRGELSIAFVECSFQVLANRIGHDEFLAAQLKTIQEVIILIVFCIFRCRISRNRSSGTIWPGLA